MTASRGLLTIGKMPKPKPRPPATMSDVLRAAVAASGLTLAAIHEATGVQPASLSRFLRGERSMRLDLADKLAAYFDLTLQPRN